MVKKEFSYRGKSLEELKRMSVEKLMELLPSRERRKLKRGFTEEEKRFLKRLRKTTKDLKTHCRDMIVLPEMVERKLLVHSGKEWTPVMITPYMIGHRLGEFVPTRRRVAHNAPGIGATRSSSAVSVR